MPYKSPKRRKEVVKKWKQKNPKKVREYNRKEYIRNRERIDRRRRSHYKLNQGDILRNQRKKYRRGRLLWDNFILDIGMGECSICGYYKCQAAIEFHHRNPTKKERRISEIISRGFSAENIFRFLEEVDKCLVVCANCHREIHNKQKGEWL